MKTGYTSLPTEHSYSFSAAEVEGAVPTDLRGVLFRNGPGLMERGGVKLDQPFDGDGMVCRFTFRDGSVSFQNRFVRTKGYQEEAVENKWIYRGAFATGNPSGGVFFNPFDFSVKNVANTHVLRWGRRLWALWEGGLPHELDSESLETLGGGASNWDGAISGQGPFAAHFKVIEDLQTHRKTLVNFGAGQAGLDAQITFYEFAEDAKLLKKTGIVLPGAAFGFYHDQLVTPNYYILFSNPVRLDTTKVLTQYMFARCSIAECLVYDPSKPMRVHLVPRDAKSSTDAQQRMRSYDLDPHFVFHHVNAFESSDGTKLVCDSVAWRSIDFSNSLKTLSPAYYAAEATTAADQRSELYRYTFDLGPGGGARRERLVQRPLEFPALAPAVVGRRHMHSYACGAAVDQPVAWGPAQTIVKVSASGPTEADLPKEVAVWAPGPRCFTQEPVFVARHNARAEDDGWLLALVHDAGAQKTRLIILDAQDIEKGPVATITLRHVVPMGLHGSWSGAE